MAYNLTEKSIIKVEFDGANKYFVASNNLYVSNQYIYDSYFFTILPVKRHIRNHFTNNIIDCSKNIYIEISL